MIELTVDDAITIASLVLELDEKTLTSMTKLGPLDSALHAPFAGYGDVDIYAEPWQKCAVLGSRIAANHPFPDGNKRVAFLAMRLFARLNGFAWTPNDEAGPIIEALAGGQMSEEDFAEWVRGDFHTA